MSDYAKDMFVRLSENYNITLVEWNHDVDHVHILFKVHPNTEMTKFVNAYKSASSRLIKRDFSQVKKPLERDVWSRSFCTRTENDLRMVLLLHYSLIAEKIVLLKVLLQRLKKYREGHRLGIGFKQPILIAVVLCTLKRRILIVNYTLFIEHQLTI